MPFSFVPFLNIETDFFILSALALVIFAQMVLGVVLPRRANGAPFMVWAAQTVLRTLSHKLNRTGRTRGSLIVRGVMAYVFLALVAWSITRLAVIISYTVPYGWVLTLVLVWGCFGVRQLWQNLRLVTAAPTLSALKKRKADIAKITGMVDPKNDPHTLARGVIMYAGYAILKHVVAPAVVFSVFGLLGLMFYVLLCTAPVPVDMGRLRKTPYFGLFHITHSLVDFIPARITGLFIVIAGVLTPTASPLKSLQALYSADQPFPSMVFGHVAKAMAGGCNTSLGGAVTYRDDLAIAPQLYPWVGPKKASAMADMVTLKRAFGLVIMVTLLCFILSLLALTL